jgi:hypothetical protein
MTDNINIEVQIHKIDKENDQIIFRPYSSNFKHDSDYYPTKAINITALHPSLDVKEQLLLLSVPLVRDILYKENPGQFDEVLKPLLPEEGKTITKQVKIEQLFDLNAIFVPQLSADQPTEETITVSTDELSSSESFNVVV